MRKIESLEAYQSLVGSHRRMLQCMQTNCMLMPQQIAEHIRKGRLFLEEYTDGLIVLLDNNCYYTGYYFWRPDTALTIHPKCKPVIMEEMNHSGRRDSYLAGWTPCLYKGGFFPIRRNLQVACVLKPEGTSLFDAYQASLDRLQENGLRLEVCRDLNCMSQVISLWEGFLEPWDVPEEHKILSADSGNILCITDKQGTVAGAYWWRYGGRRSEGRHLVTHPEYRRKGLGAMLLYAWMLEAQKHGVQMCITWINDGNHASQALYGKLGFSANGKECIQYRKDEYISD